MLSFAPANKIDEPGPRYKATAETTLTDLRPETRGPAGVLNPVEGVEAAGPLPLSMAPSLSV